MKRRTLLSSALGTLVASVSPARAVDAIGPQVKSKIKSPKVGGPYKIIEKVFDETPTLSEEIAFSNELQIARIRRVRCKHVPSGNPFRENWLIFEEIEYVDARLRTRSLSVEQVVSKKLVELLNEEYPEREPCKYDPEESFKNLPTFHSFVSVKESDEAIHSLSLGNMFISKEEISDSPVVAVLARLYTQITV